MGRSGSTQLFFLSLEHHIHDLIPDSHACFSFCAQVDLIIIYSIRLIITLGNHHLNDLLTFSFLDLKFAG